MATNKRKNTLQKTQKKQTKVTQKRSLMMTNALLATGTCCLIVASMLISFSKTKNLTYGMPGGLFMCALGAASIGLSYFDVAKRFAIICFAGAVISFACAVVTFLGTFGIVH